MRLVTMIEHGINRFGYTYDFGDDWRHEIVIEAVGAGDPAAQYLLFLSGAQRAPPEDVGGALGYEEFVKAINHPRHREHKAMLTWPGGPYDPYDTEEDEILAALAKLTRRRTLERAACLKSMGQWH